MTIGDLSPLSAAAEQQNAAEEAAFDAIISAGPPRFKGGYKNRVLARFGFQPVGP
ncbi:hypothetical protein GCM10010924_47750 [Rhizobium wenxiniae]|nr:hypothetical protein GCM10010924_47750 [Rhizobium wenxiniae]